MQSIYMTPSIIIEYDDYGKKTINITGREDTYSEEDYKFINTTIKNKGVTNIEFANIKLESFDFSKIEAQTINTVLFWPCKGKIDFTRMGNWENIETLEVSGTDFEHMEVFKKLKTLGLEGYDELEEKEFKYTKSLEEVLKTLEEEQIFLSKLTLYDYYIEEIRGHFEEIELTYQYTNAPSKIKCSTEKINLIGVEKMNKKMPIIINEEEDKKSINVTCFDLGEYKDCKDLFLGYSNVSLTCCKVDGSIEEMSNHPNTKLVGVIFSTTPHFVSFTEEKEREITYLQLDQNWENFRSFTVSKDSLKVYEFSEK